MFKKLTLRDRIFFISSALILTAIALIWVFIRPQYRETIIRERTTIVSQLQEYTLRQTDNTLRNWINSANQLAEDLILNPGETQNLVSKAINYTPGLMRIIITDISTGQEVNINRSIYDQVDYSNISPSWVTSRLSNLISISWVSDPEQDVDFFLSRRAIQIGGDIYNLDMFFNVQTLSENLVNIPLGSDDIYVANIVDANGVNIVPGAQFDFPPELVGDASFSREKTIALDDRNWFVVSSRFQSIPFWHLIAVEDSFILDPVNRLIRFSFIAAGSILFFMFIFSWYVSTRVNKPVRALLEDVGFLSDLNFEHSIRDVELPEFSQMHETLENIRLTLKRYKKINVEKIILEEWKNRYMVTYSEDMIGVIGQDRKFSFLNNQFIDLLSSLRLNPKETTLEEVLKHRNVVLSKSTQSLHYPDPFTVRVDQAELTVNGNDDASYYYDYQYLSILDENEEQQGAYVIIHDKTEDRLLDMKRNDMINVIVHELKNPITGVVGITKLIMDNQSMNRDEKNVLLKEVYMSGERMNELVNRFLEVQKLEAGKTNVDFANVDVLQIINDVKILSNPLLSSKKLKANIRVEGSDFIIKASKDLIFDAVQNLISNAIKYGDPNRTIEIQLFEEEENLKISITDFGYGISIEDQKKVFDKFFRVKSNAKAAKEKGTGLGLAYVKEIMAIHHGNIELESTPEIGSRFTLTFPKIQPSE